MKTQDEYVCPSCDPNEVIYWGLKEYREKGNPVCLECGEDVVLFTE